MRVTTGHAVAVIAVAAAAGVAYLATRSAGPVPMPVFTELRLGPLHEHLVSEDEMIGSPVFTMQRYPARVAPHLTHVVTRGFSPLYGPSDPQAAPLPAEVAW